MPEMLIECAPHGAQPVGEPGRPIADAPIRAGIYFGPCVLWPGPFSDEAPGWTVGVWNGKHWRDEWGNCFRPTF